MATLEQILNDPDDGSSLSAEASFTLQDILLEPDELLEESRPEDDEDFSEMFDDDDEEEDQDDGENQEAAREEEVDIVQAQGIKAEAGGKTKMKEEEKSRSSKAGVDKVQEKAKKIVARQRRLKEMQLPTSRQVKNMTFVPLKNVTALFENPENNGVGIPTVISATGSKFLAVGTSMGNIAIFQVGVRGYKLLGGSQHKKYGQITSITISKDNKYLVGGQQGGMMTIWDLYYFSEIKRELATRSKIIKVVFCSENEFIMNDIQGNIYLYTIEKYLWVNLKSQRIFQKSDAYYYDIKAHTLHSHTQILALCTLDYVLVLSYKPTVTPIARLTRPDDLYFSKLPNVQLGRCAVFSVFNPQNTEKLSSDVLCISWSKSIFVYKFVESKVRQLQTLELLYRFDQDSPIYNMQFISEGILVTLDNKQTFRTYRIWVNNGGGYMLINEREVPEEVIYQRFLKDKNNKYIKSYNNTIISCSFNPKDKELFFICKNSIYRCRIHRWNDAINELINCDREFMKALKLCLELYNKRFNIFLEHVQITEKTIKLFCEIGRLFLVQKLKEIEKLNEDRVKNIDQKSSIKLVQEQVEETYECLIEYMIEIKCQNFLFDKIYRDVIKQRHYSDEYHTKFLDCLEPFILNGLLTRIPTLDLFKEITGYFLKQGKKALVDNLIISLEIQSLFYTEAIEICDSNKLYRSLAYVCSTHGQYVPPLNKLLREIINAQSNNHKQAQQIYYMIIKDYIVKLLACIYINGNPLTDNSQIMKKNLSTWLTCKQTFTFFAKNAEETYQKDYFYFLEAMIQSLNQEESLKEYIHGILKQLIKERHKEKEIAELFIKISSTIGLDSEEIELIVTHSDQEIVEKHLVQFLDFIKIYHPALQKHPKTGEFILKNKQIHYFYSLETQEKPVGLLEKTKILENPDEQFNLTLVKFILQRLSSSQIAANIEDLLKIHSGSTMIYMLEKFSLEIVNERLMSIKDIEYRYLIVRKLLKILRKQAKENQIAQTRIKKESCKPLGASKLAQSSIIFHQPSQSDISTQSKASYQKKQLGKEVMQFYILCLCKYKKEKRVYYEFTAFMDDYVENLKDPSSLKVITDVLERKEYNSSLGLLEDTYSTLGLIQQSDSQKRQEKINSHYNLAYKYYSKVYRHYFFQQNYKKLMRVVHCHGRFMRRIFERMLAIAQKLNTQKLWIDLLTCVVTPLQQKSSYGSIVCDDIQQVYKKKSNHPFLMQLAEILELCLINVSNKVPISRISEFIGQHKYIFVKEFVLSSFRSTLVTYSKNAYIYILANQMIINDQVAQFDQIYSQKIKGSPINTVCQECCKDFQLHSQVNVYSCGHAYHLYCHRRQRQAPKEEHQMKIQQQPQQQQQQQISDRCQKCIVLKTGGDEFKKSTNLPDFNIQSQNILMKGIMGVANIIPSVMSVIPNPISVFTTRQQIASTAEQKESLDLEQAEDQVYDYLAFEKTLQQKEQGFNHFLSDYQRYLQRY